MGISGPATVGPFFMFRTNGYVQDERYTAGAGMRRSGASQFSTVFNAGMRRSGASQFSTVFKAGMRRSGVFPFSTVFKAGMRRNDFFQVGIVFVDVAPESYFPQITQITQIIV
jgi:hypothetical protein